MTNEQRAEALIQEVGFDFDTISKAYIAELLQNEIDHYQKGSSEYIRLLCGYLFCRGDRSDIPLMKRAKYGINMDVGCMIDFDWLSSLENDGTEDALTLSRDELIEDFIRYYKGFQASDLE